MKRCPRINITTVVLVILVSSIVTLEILRQAGVRIGEPGVNVELPDSVAGCQGFELGFCQNESCLYSFQQNPTNAISVCPRCGGEVSDISLAEHRLLPEETTVKKMVYVRSDGYRYSVSLVLSGSERRSIHNPRDCFRGQGFKLVDRRTLRLETSDSGSFTVMILDASIGEKERVRKSSYTYWFADTSHETPYIWEQVLLTAVDRVFRGEAPRWAYISVVTPHVESGSTGESELKAFVSDLRKRLRKPVDKF